MGADGSIVIANRDEFEKANPGVNPEDLGLYTGTVLGVDACWGYFGDNLFEPNYGEQYIGTRFTRVEKDGKVAREQYELTDDEKAAARKALEWFERNSEDHEVWT